MSGNRYVVPWANLATPMACTGRTALKPAFPAPPLYPASFAQEHNY
jgi:hypothetical protein